MHTDEEIPEKYKQTGMITPKFHKSAGSSDDIIQSADVPRHSPRQQKAKDSSLRPLQISPSIAPFETAFETLCADSTEKSVKRREFCKKLSVVKLTRSEACLGTSLSVSETLSSVSGKVKCAMGNTCSCSHNAECGMANLPTQAKANTRPNRPVKKR